MRTQTRAGSRRVGLNGVTLVEVTFLIELFEQVPQGLDILVVVRDIRVIEVHPIAHLLGEVGPLARVLHHLTAASRVVLIDADLLTDILFGDAEHLLYTQLNRQTVCVPTGFTAHLIALHRLETAERVLDRTCHHVVNTRHTVRRRGTFEEQELRMSLTGADTLLKQVFFFPFCQHLFAQRRQV